MDNYCYVFKLVIINRIDWSCKRSWGPSSQVSYVYNVVWIGGYVCVGVCTPACVHVCGVHCAMYAYLLRTLCVYVQVPVS